MEPQANIVRSIAGAEPPFNWRVVAMRRHTDIDGTEAVLRFGGNSVCLDEISGLRAHETEDWDVSGQLFNTLVYVLLAAGFLAGVVWFEWRLQFLGGTALFAAIAMMSMSDVITMRKVGFYRLTFVLTNGKLVTYVSPCEADRDKLADCVTRLRQRGAI